jgi:hypothetical protein
MSLRVLPVDDGDYASSVASAGAFIRTDVVSHGRRSALGSQAPRDGGRSEPPNSWLQPTAAGAIMTPPRLKPRR